MADDLTQEEVDALAVISGAKATARGALAEKLTGLLGDIDAMNPLYPDGLVTDLQQLRNYVTVTRDRLAASAQPPQEG